MRRITVDLTPLLPGGDNGGAKLVAITLVQELAALAPQTEFVLLTSQVSHAELAYLDQTNVRRQCVDADLAPTNIDSGTIGGARLVARKLVNAFVPSHARSRVKDGVWSLLKRYRRAAVASEMVADLHFCPFTAPFYFEPRVPLVSLVHDLQFLDCPEFFDEQQRRERNGHFMDACERADLLVCVSDFVRQSVLAHSGISPDRVRTIHSTVLHALSTQSGSKAQSTDILAGLGIERHRFLLYPANAWPHKNHAVLVEAFAHYLARRPDSDLALICSGAPGPHFDAIQALAAQRLPAGSFGFAGYLRERDFRTLLENCRALIFPSLYEGFGMPVLEAMACARPVLCSDVTSLPEVAGDAALFFDPHEPSAIADAIEQLDSEPKLEATLVQRGLQRAARFGSPRDVAATYLETFENVSRSRSRRASRQRSNGH